MATRAAFRRLRTFSRCREISPSSPAPVRLFSKRVAAMKTWFQAGAPWPDDFVTVPVPEKPQEVLGDAWQDP